MSYLSPASGPLRIVCVLVTSLLNSWKTQVLQLAFLGNTRLSNNKKIILYQSSIRTQLTLKENLDIQNHNHYLV